MKASFLALVLMSLSSPLAEADPGQITAKFVSFKGKGCAPGPSHGMVPTAALYVDVVSPADRKHCTGCQGAEGMENIRGKTFVFRTTEVPAQGSPKTIGFRFYAIHPNMKADHYRTEDAALTPALAKELESGEPVRKEFPTFRYTSERIPRLVETTCKLTLEFRGPKKEMVAEDSGSENVDTEATAEDKTQPAF